MWMQAEGRSGPLGKKVTKRSRMVDAGPPLRGSVSDATAVGTQDRYRLNPETGHSCPASAESNTGVDVTRSLCGAGPSLSSARSFLGGEFRCHGYQRRQRDHRRAPPARQILIARLADSEFGPGRSRYKCLADSELRYYRGYEPAHCSAHDSGGCSAHGG